jgi:hypothetical protein
MLAKNTSITGQEIVVGEFQPLALWEVVLIWQ